MYLENLNEKLDDRNLHKAFFGEVQGNHQNKNHLNEQNNEATSDNNKLETATVEEPIVDVKSQNQQNELDKLRDQVMKFRNEKKRQEQSLKNTKLGKEAEKFLTPLEKRRLKYKRDVTYPIHLFKVL